MEASNAMQRQKMCLICRGLMSWISDDGQTSSRSRRASACVRKNAKLPPTQSKGRRKAKGRRRGDDGGGDGCFERSCTP